MDFSHDIVGFLLIMAMTYCALQAFSHFLAAIQMYLGWRWRYRFMMLVTSFLMYAAWAHNSHWGWYVPLGFIFLSNWSFLVTGPPKSPKERKEFLDKTKDS